MILLCTIFQGLEDLIILEIKTKCEMPIWLKMVFPKWGLILLEN